MLRTSGRSSILTDYQREEAKEWADRAILQKVGPRNGRKGSADNDTSTDLNVRS
jgi:hypothetical protein